MLHLVRGVSSCLKWVLPIERVAMVARSIWFDWSRVKGDKLSQARYTWKKKLVIDFTYIICYSCYIVTKFNKQLKKKQICCPQLGFEPGPTVWEKNSLTTRPQSHHELLADLSLHKSNWQCSWLIASSGRYASISSMQVLWSRNGYCYGRGGRIGRYPPAPGFWMSTVNCLALLSLLTVGLVLC